MGRESLEGSKTFRNPLTNLGHVHIMGTVTNDGLLTTAELADRWGVSVRTIHRKVETGELTPAVKLPGLRGAYLFAVTERTSQ